MGVYLSKAITDKKSENGKNDIFTYSVTSMQGWRQTMEDSHIAIINEKINGIENVAIYGVFDGHGGAAVSEWIARNLIQLLKKLSTYKLNNGLHNGCCKSFPEEICEYVKLLRDTYIDLDEEMKTNESNAEILKIHNEKANIANSLSHNRNTINDLLLNPSSNFLKSIIENSTAQANALAGPSAAKVTPISSINLINDVELNEKKTNEEKDDESSNRNKHADDTENYKTEGSEEKLKTDKEKKNDVVDVSSNNTNNSKYLTEDIIPNTCGAAAVLSIVIYDKKNQPYIITANAGDSRAVLCRAGVGIPLSFDHKPILPAEFDRIYKAGGFVENGRVDGNLNLSRTLGDLVYKQNSALKPNEQKISAVPDITVTQVSDQDEFLILACDGIWDCLSNQEACNIVKAKLTEYGSSTDALKKITEEICDSCLATSPLESNGETPTISVPNWTKKVTNKMKGGIQTMNERTISSTKSVIGKVNPKVNSSTPSTKSIKFQQPNKYFIENYVNETEILDLDAKDLEITIKDAVMISKCENLTIVINKKICKLEVNSCKGVKVVIASVLCSIDIQNANGCDIHVRSSCPALSIDNSVSIRVHIPESNIENLEVSSSGYGSADVIIYYEDESINETVYTIPFQYVHKIVNKKLETKVSPLYSY